MPEQPLVEYCTNKKTHTENTNMPLLSPINLLRITLWYLKHCYSEHYIVAELRFNQTSVNYFLSTVVGILHSCICLKLIWLPDEIDDDDTMRRPKKHHRLILNSTYIANNQSEDSTQRKTCYHAKSPTNYAFKIQITCDFHHQTVHISNCYQRSTHDINILMESGLLEHAHEDVQVIVDTGYIGEKYAITPQKRASRW